jgi:Dyp-type peroxidase family
VPPEAPPLRSSENIQGNVLSAFNKDHARFVLVSLPTEAKQARAWLAEVEPLVATVREVEDFNEEFSRRRREAPTDLASMAARWVGLGLTVTGLRKLVTDPAGLDAELASLVAARRPPVLGETLSFVAGPAAHARELGDVGPSAPQAWLFGGPGSPVIDAVVNIAADRPDDIEELESQIRGICEGHGVVVQFVQDGETLPGPAAGHEHFGFKDGISQPGVRDFHRPDPGRPGERLDHPGQQLIAPGEFVLGYPDETGNTVAVPEWMRDGSFQVLRRLAQDVPGWWAQVHAARAGSPPADREKLAAQLVGRWRSGASLANHPEADPGGGAPPEDNDFGYQQADPRGITTPTWSHIRKTLPRDADPPGAASSARRRIMRRGIPFGPPFNPAAELGNGLDAERGLVFVCYCASIEGQFEFLQRFWSNNPDFPGTSDGPDPVIGQAPAPAAGGLLGFLSNSPLLFRLVNLIRSFLGRVPSADRGAPVAIRHPLGATEFLTLRRFVRTQGAIYAFAPGRAALRRLAAGQV